MKIVLTIKTYFRVMFSEIDRMGIVHHSNYVLWFEKGRRDFLKKAGMPNSQINSRGFYLPLSEIECSYKSPAKHGDEIVVITKILSMSCVKIKFEYKVMDKGEAKLIANGKTVHVWTNQKIEPINIEKAAPDIYLGLKRFSEYQVAE